jgi:glycosyltransferase involved in cell wall biosynthesis
VRNAARPGRPYVVLVGWADPRKDLALAVAAHGPSSRPGRPHDLVLVGRPHPTFAPVQVPDLPSVRRAGYLPDGGLQALLTGAAALLYPSRYEGFGLPPLEAWACGTPALVSDVPVLRETTGGQGVLLRPATWPPGRRRCRRPWTGSCRSLRSRPGRGTTPPATCSPSSAPSPSPL